MVDRQRVGLSDRVYEHVKRLLLEGRIAADKTLPIDAIGSELGVSRQPVMDAMKRLSAEGFVTIIPQVGCFRRNYTMQAVQDFFVLFSDGEATVAELACERAQDTELAQLRSISAEIGLLRAADLAGTALGAQYRVLNRRFHAVIRIAARSEAVTEVVERLGDQSDFFIAVANAPIFAQRLRTAHDEHEAMIAAIAEHRPLLARAIMKTHILAIPSRINASTG